MRDQRSAPNETVVEETRPSFDVFLSYTKRDGETVERVARRLVDAGIHPFYDRWSLMPGDRWQVVLAEALAHSSACAVFVGAAGLGDWAREELAVAQDRAARDPRFRLFMVLLEGAPRIDDPRLAFLNTRTWVDLRAGVTDADALDDLLAAVTGSPRRRRPAAPATTAACPYRGLARFDEDDADFFFGREEDARQLVERLRDTRFLAVLGASGSGKSSLVRAGLVPALRRGVLSGSDRWLVRVFTPGGRPVDSLAAAVVRLVDGSSMREIVDDMQRDERALDLALTLGLANHDLCPRVLFLVDQFEEAFTLCSDETQRAAFLSNLGYAATIPGGRTAVVLAMRADFYHRCATYPRLRALVAAQQFLVGPMDSFGLRRAIEEPAWRSGIELEPGLVETLVGAVDGEPGALPMLQHLLLELWERRNGRMLTLAAYAACGGVRGALAQRADRVYEELSPGRRETTRRVLLRLTQPGEGTKDTRCRLDIAELATGVDRPDDVDAVVGALADSRLLTTSRDATTGARLVEITHEALLDGWPLLRGWIDADRETLLAERRLNDAAREWVASGRDAELLYRGARLAAWAERDLDTLSPSEREFIAAARARAARERSSRRRRVRLAFVVLGAIIAAVAAAALVAVRAGRSAARDRDIARSTQLASVATDELAARPVESLRDALRAYETYRTTAAAAALREATYTYRAIAGRLDRKGNLYSVAASPDGRYIASAGVGGVSLWSWRDGQSTRLLDRGESFAVAFSPDGRQLASTGSDRTIRIWEIPDGRIRIVGHTSATVLALAFGGDGRLATADQLGAVQIWSLREPGRAIHVGRVGRPARTIAFSGDVRTLVAGGSGGAVKVWRGPTFRRSVTLDAGRREINGVAVSPDGRTIAAAGGDGKLRTWRLGSLRPAHAVDAQPGAVYGVAFLDDGRLATGGEDGTVRIWDREGNQLSSLAGPAGRTYAVAPGPGRARIVSAGEDGKIWVWQPPDVRVLDAGGKPIFALALSRDGKRVAAVGDDGVIRVWQTTAKLMRPSVVGFSRKDLTGVAFDPDAARLVAVGVDGVVRLLHVHKVAPTILEHANAPVYAAAFADKDHVVAGGADGTVRLIDVRSRRSTVLVKHGGAVTDLAVTADGRRIVSVGSDKAVRVAAVSASREPRLAGRSDQVLSGVDVAPDNERLVTTGVDGTVWLGTLSRPFEAKLPGQAGAVWRASFTPDGRRLLTAGNDGTVRLWDLSTRTALVFRGNGGQVVGVRMTPDGRYVVSAGADGLIRVRRCDVCGPIDEVLRQARSRWLPDG